MKILMSKKITIRQYDYSDAQDLANIYYYTIHNINSKDYSEEQINAWAPSSSLEKNRVERKMGGNSSYHCANR